MRFAVIGDAGTGGDAQYAVGRQMESFRAQFPFDLVLMLGDNLYRRASPQVYASAFERPYAALLADHVKFVAVLGNHDSPESVSYPGWNMNGQRYFSFTRNHVRFFALDTNLLDATQLEWLEQTLSHVARNRGRSPTSTTRSTPTADGTDRTSSCAYGSSRSSCVMASRSCSPAMTTPTSG